MTGLIGKDMRAVVCQEGEKEVLFYTDLASGRLVNKTEPVTHLVGQGQ